MISDPDGTVLALFAAFCRIGGCIMVLPGFSSARISLQIRILLAVAVSMAILPVLWDQIYPQVTGKGHPYLLLVTFETVIGVVFGLITRYYVLGLQFAGTVLTMMIGFNAPPTADVLEDTAENQLTNMISFAGLLILFLMDFHHVVFSALVDSYTSMPIGAKFDPQNVLITLTNTLSQTFFIMLRLASPYILYGLLFNIAVGFVNKLAPAIPIYFISTPYLIAGGMFLVYFGIAAMLKLFADGFGPILRGL